MNLHASSDNQAERARVKGKAIYRKLLPSFKKEGVKAGLFVAINIETGKYVVAESRLDLMQSYKEQFGHAPGWVSRVEYQKDE